MKTLIACMIYSCIVFQAYAQLPCTTDINCDDGNACTTDFCNNNFCMYHETELLLTASGINPTSCDPCNGSVSVAVSGGTAPYEFIWSTGDTVNSSPGSGTEKCINAGGAQFITAAGDTFLADTDYAGGTNYTNAVAIANTTDDALYQNERYVANGGVFNYNIPVANGDYIVELHFAEIFYGTPGHPGGVGSRLFDVLIEGTLVLDDYDIFADAGGVAIAIIKSFHTTVSDGVLNIAFDGVVNNAKVNALCVKPATTQPAVTGLCAGTYSVTVTDANGCTAQDIIVLTDTCSNNPCDTLVCFDNDLCTFDGCVNGECVFTAFDCNDNNSCTSDDCVNGNCLNPVNCSDNNPCTIDACVSNNCVSTPITCNDNDACTSDACVNGICVFTLNTCNDNNECTSDTCVNGNCVNTLTNCEDNNPCTIDVCISGTCINTVITCNDNDGCTSDACVNGNCVFTPISCNDNNACTADACVNGNCVNTPFTCNDNDACTNDFCQNGQCIFNSITCNDGNSCTIDQCVQGSCVFLPIPNCVTPCDTAAFDESIVEESLSEFCQGAEVKLTVVAPEGSTFLWSTGDTSRSIAADAGAAYSVVITDSNGCVTVLVHTTSELEDLLSAYVILAEKEVELDKNTVFSGGVGATAPQGKVRFKNQSVATAPGTFAKAADIQISGASTVTTQIPSPVTVALPTFEYNTFCQLGNSLQIPANSIVTLSGNLYNGITIGKNSVVTFTQADINVENIHTRENVTIMFDASCAKVRICKKLQLGKHNSFNPDNSDVIVFVEKDVTIDGGSTVTADIYMNGGKMSVKKAPVNSANVLIGQFIVKMLKADGVTFWYQNNACGDCETDSLTCEDERTNIAFTLVNADTDADIGTLHDGDVIDLVITGDISVRANVCNEANTESVKFLVNGNLERVENIAPYTIAGDNNGNYNPWSVQPGTYVINAIPYSGNNASGAAGSAGSVTITIIGIANKNNGIAPTGAVAESESVLSAYPNPFSEKLNIEFMVPVSSHVLLEVYSISGQRLAVLYDAEAVGEKTYKMEFINSNLPGGMVIYKLQTPAGAKYGKVIIAR